MKYAKKKMSLRKFIQRKITIFGSLILICVVIVNPYGISSGGIDSDPYSPIRSELAKTKNGKLMLLSSFDDFYSIRSNDDLRRETSEAYVERGYDEILSAASLGNEFFNSFLHSKGITHVLVPLSTSQRGEVQYKWGELGSIRVQLSEPFFTPVVGTAGDYPVVLYRVLAGDLNEKHSVSDPRYAIRWGPEIRGNFYQPIRTKAENGLYSHEYDKSYESGLDVNWVFAYPRNFEGLPDIPEIAEFRYQSDSVEMKTVYVEVTLVAAYGPLAPPQIVRVIQNGISNAYELTANQPAVVKLNLNDGDAVRFSNVLPCRQPQTFQPGEEDWRKYCFGISDIQVRLQS